MSSLKSMVQSHGLFQGYAYGYPHKTAYRALTPPKALADAWANEDQQSLFLYIHIPYCEMRCGFCNLFTTTGATDQTTHRYLDALERQAEAVRHSVLSDNATLSRIAVGGGTPTVLDMAGLERLLGILQTFGERSPSLPFGIEMSPATAEPEKLHWLRDVAGVTRASLGVQSFVEAETRTLGRPQKRAEVETALAAMQAAAFPVRNVDLIYGIVGQTRASWLESLSAALAWQPEEVFLYPLYVRPLTGLGRKGRAPADDRDDLYRTGRDYLLEHGYRQISMRLFRSSQHPGDAGPHYCCQEDGMVGLGAGARSYTRQLHYSSEWAVGRTGISAILADYCDRTDEQFRHADYGCLVNLEEQKRRYVIKSLLRSEGLDIQAYQTQFQSEALEDFPCLHELFETQAAESLPNQIRPTQLGLEWSDVVGPWLYSDTIKTRMSAFELS